MSVLGAVVGSDRAPTRSRANRGRGPDKTQRETDENEERASCHEVREEKGRMKQERKKGMRREK